MFCTLRLQCIFEVDSPSLDFWQVAAKLRVEQERSQKFKGEAYTLPIRLKTSALQWLLRSCPLNVLMPQ
jgi:hypothetical protein